MKLTSLAAIAPLFLLAACADGGEDALCEEAGLVPELCSTIYNSSAGGKVDDLIKMKGIVVERVGNRTFFKIPLAYTAEGDKRRLLDETVNKFTAEMGRLNQGMIERGLDIGGILDETTANEFDDNYLSALHRVFDTDVEGDMAVELGESYSEPRELWAWQRYLVPQAFMAYFGTKFSANLGVGGGVSATVIVVVQPWLALEIDHTEAEPKVVDKAYQVDAAILGVPNLEVGFGIGGGMPLRIGAGAVFGPLNRPEDIAGWGIGLAGSFTLPLVGGGSAKFITVLQDPPLFLAMAGYSTGTSAGAEIHGNVQYIMELGEFLSWLKTSVE